MNSKFYTEHLQIKSLFQSMHAAEIQKRILYHYIAVEKTQKSKVVGKLVRTKYNASTISKHNKQMHASMSSVC